MKFGRVLNLTNNCLSVWVYLGNVWVVGFNKWECVGFGIVKIDSGYTSTILDIGITLKMHVLNQGCNTP